MFGIEKDRKNRTHAMGYVAFGKKDRVDESTQDDRSFVRVFATPKAAAKLIELSSRATSSARTFLPISEKTRRREPIRRVPRIAPVSGGSREGMSQMLSRETLGRRLPPDLAVVGETAVSVEKSVTGPSDSTIDTTNLRDFALRKLPERSILREVILLEEKELTPEQFLSKLPIWLHLLDRGE